VDLTQKSFWEKSIELIEQQVDQFERFGKGIEKRVKEQKDFVEFNIKKGSRFKRTPLLYIVPFAFLGVCQRISGLTKSPTILARIQAMMAAPKEFK